MNASRSLPRALAWALTAVSLLLLSAKVMNAQIYHGGSCIIPPPDGCVPTSDWIRTDIVRQLPGYPGCDVELVYEYRTCIDGGVEIRLVYISWDNDLTDPNNPCALLHNDYLGVRNFGFTGSREAFMRKIFQISLQEAITFEFNRNYTFDSLNAAAFPNNQQLQEVLQQSHCPNGIKRYRAVLAQCMLAITKTDTISWTYGRGRAHRDDKGSSDVSLASVSEDLSPWVIRTSVRWMPCDEAETTFCCLQTTTVCRNPATGQNSKTVTATPYGGTVNCPDEADPYYLTPYLGVNETAGKCLPYCVEGEAYRPEGGEGGSDVPTLSTR